MLGMEGEENDLALVEKVLEVHREGLHRRVEWVTVKEA